MENQSALYLRQSGLDYTIIRPGSLTEDSGTGRVQVAERLDEFGEIAREDVAAALLATLDAANTVGISYDLLAGETPVEQALAGL